MTRFCFFLKVVYLYSQLHRSLHPSTPISNRICVTVMASSALDLLVRCAEAIRDGNLKDADSLLEQIWELADHASDERQSEIMPSSMPRWERSNCTSFTLTSQKQLHSKTCSSKQVHVTPIPYQSVNHYRREIHNIVGCEGRDRIVRHQTLAQWQSHLQSAGFLPFPLELPKHLQDDDDDDDDGDGIHEHNGSAVFTLRNRPFLFISAWKHTDKENHFNPTRSNFAEGFNPSPLLEDRVQPFQPFPEGSSLNRLAALVEIYTILEEVCFTYDLPLALTWTCGSKVNENMSYAYEKRTLFIQSTFCYSSEGDWEFQDFIKSCEKQQLLEGQAIAGKALQSNEDFHFESTTTELEKLDCPLADICEYLPSSCSVVAICLHNSHAMDADYVVEFFLPTSETRSENPESENPESLAFRIFNDLKNMKKVFVTVGIQVIQGRFQEKAISNISQVTMPRRNPPPASSTNYLPYSNTRDSCEMEIQELNEQARGKHAFVNNLLTSSAKRRKLTSKVWNEFTKKEDGDGKVCAICAHCNRKFDGSSTKGTTHLRNHLKRCKSRPTNVRDQQLILPVGRDDSKSESARECKSSFDQDRSSMNFARLIIKRQWPLNIVEDDFFSSFLKELQPMFKLQSQEALSSDIVSVYKEEKQKLFEYFGKISCRLNFTISVWIHDFQKTTYCCYAVQFIDDNWELKKKILALKSLGNQFDKRIFYENFKNFLMDWNFDKKVCSLTIQNFSSCFDIDEEIRKNWHCFEASHPLSTFYISSDKCIRGLLGKDDNSVENVGKSNGNVRTSNACLLELSQQEKIGYPLMDVKSDNNWRTCNLLLAIAAVLDPQFKFDFVEFSYYRIYDNDAARIQLRMIRNALTGIFDEYASNMYRGTSISNDINSSSTFFNAEKNTVESFHRWYNSKRSVNSEDSWKSELDKYVHEPIISFNPEFDILGWWCEQASSFPVLGRIVRDILAIPMSSIISRSAFTEKIMLDNPIYNGLNPKIIEAMICSRDWLESPEGKLNKRSENIGIPILRLENSPALAHHSKIKRFYSESDNEAPWNEDEATWTEKNVRAYLVSPFTVEDSEYLRKWQNHAISGEYVGRDRIQDKALAPLLKIPPHDVDLKDTRNYYIEDTVVNQFFVLLKRRYERFPHKYLKHHSIDSSYAALLINQSKDKCEVLKWVIQEDLKGVSKLFLPMCLDEHWLLFVADIEDKKLLLLDSIQHSRISNVSKINVIRQWFLEYLLPSMGHDQKDWSFDVPKDIPQQKNSVDCALFVMKYADCLTHGNYFPFTQDDMPHFRHRTFLDLHSGSISLGRSQDGRANHAQQQNTAKAERKMNEKESTSLVKISEKWNSEETKSTGDNAIDYNIENFILIALETDC